MRRPRKEDVARWLWKAGGWLFRKIAWLYFFTAPLILTMCLYRCRFFLALVVIYVDVKCADYLDIP